MKTVMSGDKLDGLKKERSTSRRGDFVIPITKKDDSYWRLPGGDEDATVFSRVASVITVLQWLPSYNWRENFFYDVVGGTTIALICLVQTLAHASIATTDVIQGPYCAFVPPFVYALLGTSPHASISSGAIAAILIADQLKAWPDMQARTELASLLSFITGMILVVMGLARAAYAVRFLSQSLISGFVTGGSVLIIVGQLKNLLGLTMMPHTSTVLEAIEKLVEFSPQTNYIGLCLGLTMMALLQIMMWVKKWTVEELKKKGKPRPWLIVIKIFTEAKELVLVVISVIFAYVSSDADGKPLLPVVGHITPGLPPFKMPWDSDAAAKLLGQTDLSHTQTVIENYVLHHFFVGGMLVAVTSFLTTYATSKKQALAHSYSIDASQEMFALGMAGACGSFFGSFPPSGSLSRTSLASEVGVKSQMSGLMKIVVVGGSLMYLTEVLFYLPKATLAAIILRSTWSLVDTDTAKTLWEGWKPRREGGQRRDMVVWLLSLILTIWFGVLYGIATSVLISLLMLIRDAAVPRVVILGQLESQGFIWRDVEVWHEGRTIPQILVVEFRGALSFASADWFQEEMERIRIREDARNPYKIKVIVMTFGSVHDLDPTALAMLRDLLTAWRAHGVSCIICDAKSRVRLLIESHFAHPTAKNKRPLLDQSAFMIGINDAVNMAMAHISPKQEDAPGRTVSGSVGVSSRFMRTVSDVQDSSPLSPQRVNPFRI